MSDAATGANAHARLPKQARSRESFERVIEATIDLLAERSYDQLTLADISQRSGVSTGSMYGRVAGKDDLLRVVQARFFERFAERHNELVCSVEAQGPDLRQVVPAVVRGLSGLLKENASILRAFMLRAPQDEVIELAGRRFAVTVHAQLLQVVMNCKDQILHPDPVRAIEVSFLVIHAAQARYLGLDTLGGAGEGSWDKLVQDLSDMMLAFLLFTPSAVATVPSIATLKAAAGRKPGKASAKLTKPGKPPATRAARPRAAPRG